MSEDWYTEVPKDALVTRRDLTPPYQANADDSDIREQYRAGLATIPEERRMATTFAESLKAGWQGSVWGLSGLPGGRERLPEIYLPEDPGMADFVGYQVGALAGDWPFMLAGAALGVAPGGGVFSAITAGGGALALPAGLRRVLIDKYERGEVDSFARFWQMLSGAVLDEFKGWVLGATTAGAGRVAGVSPVLPRTSALTAEIGTLGTMGAALEGRVPDLKDLSGAAIIVGGMRGVGFTRAKLGEAFARTGRHPYEIVRDTEADPTIKEDLNSISIESPRAYKALEERPTAEPTKEAAEAAPKETLPERPEITEQEAYDEIRSRLSIGEKEPKRPYTFHDFYTHYVESVHPIAVITNAMKKSLEKDDPSFALKASEDPYVLSRLRPGVTALGTHFIDWAPIRFADRMPLGKPLRKILGPVRYLEAWDVYATAKRARELHARGIETGMSEEAAAKVIADMEGRAADKEGGRTYEAVRQEQRQFSRYTLEYLRDSGIISSEAFELMDKLNEAYVPFERYFEEPKPRAKGGRGRAARDPTRRIFGSEEKVISPSETIIKNTYLLANAAESNRIASALVDLVEASPEGMRFAKRVETKVRKLTVTEDEKERLLKRFMRDRDELTDEELSGIADFLEEEMEFFRPKQMRPKPNQIAVFREGKRELWEVDPEVAEAVHGATAGEIGALQKFFTTPARMLRAGAILTPEFMARNPVRDAFMAFVNSKSGYDLFTRWFSGVYALARQPDWVSAYRRSGAPMSEIIAMDRTSNSTTVKDLGREMWWRATRNSMRNPIEGLRLLSTVSELGTRVGEFKRSMRKAGYENPMEADIDSLLEAGLESREISLDFGRMGSRAAALNRAIPFWNASIQGLDKVARNFQERPAATATKIALGITIPSIVLYLHNRNMEGWDEIPQWQKDLFWLYPIEGDRISSLPDWMKVRIGDKVWMRIPKPFEVGIVFGSGAERIANSILHDNPRAFDDFAETIWRGTSPGFIPTAVAPIIETFANRSLWLDRPLIPRRREDVLPKFQYQPYTTSLSRTIGKYIARLPMIGDTKAASPIVVDTFVRDWSGLLGTHVMNLADAALRKAGAIPDPPKPMDTLADLPLFKAFFVRYPSLSAESINRFYERYGEHQRVINTINMLKREGEFSEYIKLQKAYAGRTIDLTSIANAMSTWSRVVRTMEANPDKKLSPEERSQIQENVIHMMVRAAEAGNNIMDRLEKMERQRAKKR